MVRGRQRSLLVGAARSVDTEPVAEPRDDPWLVLRDPVAHAIPEPGRDDFDVLRERLHRVAGRPPAAVLERLRKVPVVEGHVRVDARGEEVVDEAVVVVEAGRVHAPGPVGKDARPRDREAKGVEPQLADQAEVLRPSVVRVAGDRARVACHDVPGHVAEAIPDALAATVLAGRSFDLVGGRGRAPDEVGRKSPYAVGCKLCH